MIGALQFFSILLVLVSFIMVVGVPVVLASPNEWEKSKVLVFSGAGLWGGLVVLTGIFSTATA
uniref:Photosystem II reaction center protein Z n=1 Tax=Haptophyceae sp. NIES-3900 TaxID=2748608 RepID=A0A7R7AJ34_9EUKA|nr:photosystem II protein Z [Haptophyceae sp. NIES-3900]